MTTELLYIFGMPLTLIAVWCAEMVCRGIRIRRYTNYMYATCHASMRMVRMLHYSRTVEKEKTLLRALQGIASIFTHRPARQELVGGTALLLEAIIRLRESLPHVDSKVQSLFDECYLLADRRGKVCRHLLAILQAEKVTDVGVFPYIQKHFTSLVRDELPDMEIECNMPHRRFAAKAEEDMAMVFLSLLVHTLYNRTPSSLRFYLLYAGSTVTLHLMDDDRHSITNLDLYHTPVDEWPACYQMAGLLADIYNGYLTIDPTYTKGIQLELKMRLKENY